MLFHGRCDRRRDLRQALDRRADLLDRHHRILGCCLNAGYLLADFASGFGGLLGEGLYLGRNHCKTSSGLAGAGRLNGGIQGEKIGLSGNGVDQLNDVTDACSGF